jgi:flagellar basal body-associated protein FliL
MSKKRILLVVLCLVGTLVVLAMMLPALAAGRKRHGTRFHTVNSAPASITFTLTNNSATNGLSVSKP